MATSNGITGDMVVKMGQNAAKRDKEAARKVLHSAGFKNIQDVLSLEHKPVWEDIWFEFRNIVHADLNADNGTVADSLIAEPKKDDFNTESPIRAFTTFAVEGLTGHDGDAPGDSGIKHHRGPENGRDFLDDVAQLGIVHRQLPFFFLGLRRARKE